MTVTETLGGLGSWSLTLSDQTPRGVLDALGFFGHVVIVRGRVDVDQVAGTGLLQAARYVGVLREKPTNARSLEGSGMAFWLGDEDNKGAVLESAVVLTAKTLPQCIAAVLPPSVHVGTINDPGGTYTGTHQWETPRQSLDTICAAFNVEYRVNGDGTLDVGTQAQLYSATPDSIVSARGAGNDFDVQSIGGTFASDVSAVDYSSRVVLLGQTTDQKQIATAAANAPAVPYRDLFGNTVAMTRMVADSGQTPGSVAASAALQLNRFNRLATALKVTAQEYETAGNFVVGDNSWVFDPDNGIYDATKQLDFRGELIFPAVVRITGITWPVTDGYTVAFRAQDGTWLDLTRWVMWEAGTDEITVGDLPKTLTSGGNPVQQYAQTAGDASIPGPVTGLTLSSIAVQSSKGTSTATLSVSWSAPAQNTNGSVVTDIDHYLVQYRWHPRAPLWTTLISPTTSLDIPGLSVGLPYDVQVAAVDRSGNQSAWNVSGTTTAYDQTAPNPPSDPTVTSYLGQLRIAWDGKDNTGAGMPSDFAIVEVHVSATSGFTPVAGPGSTTLVDQLSTAGVSYATAPYGAARYVKLVSVDNSGNRSTPSGQVTGTTVQVADGDVQSLSVGKLTAGTMSADVTVSGRFATALTGARVEMNALGFQKFDTDGVTKLISLTGTEALLTGAYKTALTGRRIEVGSAGTIGAINFFAPDGTKALVQAFTSSLGVEALRLAANVADQSSVSNAWNAVQIQTDESVNLISGNVTADVGGNGPNSTKGFIVNWVPNRGTAAGNFPPTGTVTRLFVGPNDTTIRGTDGTTRQLISDSQTVIYGNGVSRLSIQNGGGFTLWDRVSKAVIADDDSSFRIYGAHNFNGQSYYGPNAYWELQAPANIQTSVITRYWSSPQSNGSSYGSAFYFAMDSTPGTNERMEVKHWDVGSYIALWASAFTVSSDIDSKTDVRPYADDALTRIRSAKVKKYTRRPGGNSIAGPTEIGLIAQEAPAQIVTMKDGEPMGVDLYQMSALLWASVSQIADRLDAIDGGKAK